MFISSNNENRINELCDELKILLEKLNGIYITR